MGGGRGSGRYPQRRFDGDVPLRSWVWCLVLCGLIGAGIGVLNWAKGVAQERRGAAEGGSRFGCEAAPSIAATADASGCIAGKCGDGCCRKGKHDCCCLVRDHCRCEELPDPGVEDERDG
jgi:hypothetical protein